MHTLRRPRCATAVTDLLIAAIAIVAAACGGSDNTTTGPPATGEVSVTVTQHGNGTYAGGFTVTVVGLATVVHPGTPINWAPIAAGSYHAVLSGMPSGCSADADTVNVVVVAGQTADAQFAVGCFGAIAFDMSYDLTNHQIQYLAEDGSLVSLTSGTSSNILEDFAPDGSRVLFTSDRGGSKDLYTVKIDGTGLLRLTTDPRDVITARWSPDGSKIAFWREAVGGAEPFSLYVVNANGTGEHLVLDLSKDDFDPGWSADGLTIVFSCNRYGNLWDLCSVAPDGSGLHRILYSNGAQHSRTSPAGTHVAFQSYEGGVQSIWVANLADTSRVDLTPGSTSFDFAWSPDGTKLIVGTYDGADYFLQRVNRDGTGLAPLTVATDAAGDARWSPDGGRIVFYSFRGGPQEIWVMRPDGSDVHRVTASGPAKFRPLWNPTAHATADIVRSGNAGSR